MAPPPTPPTPHPLAVDAPGLDAIAALCARSLLDPPSRAELEAALTAPEQPAVVRGDPGIGVVATVEGDGQGYVRLLAVSPEHRRRGHGRALLAAAEADVRERGLPSITVGADAPYYLWPGVDARELGTACLLERARYVRAETNFNMDLDLATLPPDPGGWMLGTAADAVELDSWARRWWESWRLELLRAAARGTLVLSRDHEGIAGVCAFDVTRRGLVGPVAVRHDLLGRGAGVAPLLGALHHLRRERRERVEIAWVGPIVPYARVGATVGRTFFVYRKALV